MSQRSTGGYIVAAAVIIALGMYSLGSSIRVAGNMIGAGASNGGTDVAFPQDLAGRFRVERAAGDLAKEGRETFWIFDVANNEVSLVEFWVDQYGLVERNVRFQGRLR